LSRVREIYIHGVGGTNRRRAGVYRIIRKLLTFPLLRGFRPLARRVARVLEKPGRLSVQLTPAHISHEGKCQGLTVISANLWHDWPQYRRREQRLEAFAQLVEEHRADILLLQEVSRTTRFQADEWLARRLGMTWIYSRANGHLAGIGFEEGLAVFSRHPLGQPVLRQLSPPANQFVHRMALGASVSSPYGNLFVFSVHLSLTGRQNSREAAKLVDWVEESSTGLPPLVGGDFNAGEDTHQIKTLQQSWLDTFRHLNPCADGATHELCWPWGNLLRRQRLDYIFLKARQNYWNVLEARHLVTRGAQHSDYRAVLLRLAPVRVTT
jgi:beta-glucosidase